MTTVAFEHSFYSVEHELRGFAMKLTKNVQDANDLFQETALKAFRYKHTFKPGSRFKSWVSTIMYNTFVNIYRKKRRRKTSSESVETVCYDVADQNFSTPIQQMSKEAIETCIEELKPRFKDPFLMHIDGFKYQEIAEQYDIPIGTVKSRINSARKKIITRLEDRSAY